MNKIHVILQPTKKDMTVPQPDGKKALTYTPIGGVTVRMEHFGNGTSAVTDSAQDAKFELLEIPGTNDTSKKSRVLFSIDGTIIDKSGVPFFDSSAPPALPPTTLFSRKKSDFFIDLKFAPDNFKIPGKDTALVLPWESSAEHFTMEVRARLSVAGKVESDPALNDTLDLTMNNLSVPNDGTDDADPSDGIGIGTVYLTKNYLLNENERILAKGKTIAIFVEDAVGQQANALKPNSYSVPALTKSLTTIMADAGFGKLAVTEFKRTDLRATALWDDASGEVVAKGIKDPKGPDSDPSAVLPFFTYWVFANTSSNPPDDNEGAIAELLSDVVNIAAATKPVYKPITLFLRAGTPLAKAIGSTLADEVPNAIATLIAHEVGHGMGLRHGLHFDISAGTYSVEPSRCLGTMAGQHVEEHVKGEGHALAQLFGPVHKEVLKKHFL
jgi:hypothetical protein